MRVRVDEFGFAARDGAAFGIGEPRVDGQRSAFRRLAERDRRVDGRDPTDDRDRGPESSARGGRDRRVPPPVLRGVARDRERLCDRSVDRLRREVGGARVAAPLPDVDGDADTLVAVVGDRLDLATAHGHALPDGLRNFGFGSGRAARLCRREDRLGDPLELGSRQWQTPRPGHSLRGSGGALRVAAACSLDGGSHR